MASTYRRETMLLYVDAFNESLNLGFRGICVPVLIEALLKVPNSRFKNYLRKAKSEEDIIFDVLENIVIADEIEEYGKIMRQFENATPTNQKKSKSLSKLSYVQWDMTLSQNERLTIFADNQSSRIMSKTIKYAQSVNSEFVEPDHLLYTMIEEMPEALEKFLKLLEIDIIAIKDEFSKKNYVKLHVIPYDLSDCMTILNEKFDKGEPSNILSRERETGKIWDILSKNTKRNVILVGEAGVGKSSVVEEVTNQIVNGKCPAQFKECIVVMLNVNSMIAGTKYRGQAEEKFEKLIKFLDETPNVILFIDEIHSILSAGSVSESKGLDLANSLKPILARGQTMVIGATTLYEYEVLFSRDGALKRRFEKVYIREPNINETYKMVQAKVKTLQKYHGVKISNKLVKYSIIIAACFKNQNRNPDRTLDVIDRVLVEAKLEGKKNVTKDMILKVFDTNIKQYNAMPLEEKQAIAYHKAGHYLFMKKSKKLLNYRRIAVSVLPTSEYIGLNVYEYDETTIVLKDRQYYLDQMAYFLSGRIAEKKLTNEESISSAADIGIATKIAESVVKEFAMFDSFEYNRIFIGDEQTRLITEETKEFLDQEINKALDNAYEIAEKFVDKNEELITAIANKLVEREMMTDEELSQFCDEFERENR